jgi:fimbrial isopeptide formation D2 family protein/LPXTG-motif cell wall-anchored protein
MKTSKKILSVLLALTLVLALSVCAFAADSYTITINSTASGHTYEAYQIFSGDLSESTLSNIKWGSGVSAAGQTALGNAATKAATLKTAEDAKAFAQEVGPYLTSAAGNSTEKAGPYTISGLAAGYYLVKDKDGTQTGTDAYTGYILEVVKNTTVVPKGTVPTVQKKVKDTNDSTGVTTDWQDSADYDIGDTVPFQLTGTLPENYADYTTYKYTFHDAESTGLTFNPDSVVVKADGNTITSGYTVVTTGLTDGCTFEVQFADLKTAAPALTAKSVITVEYTATLNNDAKLGSAGNPNTVYLQFSNNYNQGGSGDTGKTPTDKVIVFTYKTVVNKVDSNKQPLTGAEFTLEKLYKGADGAADSWKAVAVVKNTEGTTFTFSGLDDGSYRLSETTTPAGYNTIDDVYFTVSADHDITSDNPALTSLSATQTAADGSSLSTGVIATFTAVPTDGSLTTDIVNNSGSTLPSTGGIGTTIFTVAGIVLMIGAAVVLVTKRKVSGEDQK